MKQIRSHLLLLSLYCVVAFGPRWDRPRADLICYQQSRQPVAEFQNMDACSEGTDLREEWRYCTCSRKGDSNLYFYLLVPAAFIAAALWLLTGRWRIQSLQLFVTIVAGGVVYAARSLWHGQAILDGLSLAFGVGLVLAVTRGIQARVGTTKTESDSRKYASRMQRGLLVLMMLTFAPYLAASELTMVARSFQMFRIANVAFGFALMWVSIVMPQFGMEPQVFSGPASMIVALVQWGIVGLVVGRLTTRYSLMQTLGISIGSLFVVAAFTRLALRVLGYQVIFEGP